MAIEQFVPFVSDYKFFEDMGVRVFANGHSFSGVQLHHPQRVLGHPGYEEAMKARLRRGARARDPRQSRATTPSTTRA